MSRDTDGKETQANMHVVVLINDDLMPDSNTDDPTQVTNTTGPVTQAVWTLMNKKLGNTNDSKSNIRVVNSVVVEVGVDNLPDGKPFKLNLFIRPQISIVS